jgi:hypothetical protein
MADSLRIYDWVAAVYRAFGIDFPGDGRGAALLGVREAALAGTDRYAASPSALTNDLGAALTRTDDAAARFAAWSGREPDMNAAPTQYDDLLFAVWTDDADKRWAAFACTVDPGKKSDDAVGIPYLCEGHAYECQPGPHHASSEIPPVDSDGEYSALWISNRGQPYVCSRKTDPNYNPATATVSIWAQGDGDATIRAVRSAVPTRRVLDDVACAKVSAASDGANAAWEFCADEKGNASVHVHYSYTPDGPVGGMSTGCTVLQFFHHNPAHGNDLSRDSPVYTHFKRIVNQAGNTIDAYPPTVTAGIPYVVASRRYLRMPDEWFQLTPEERADPLSAIAQDRLTADPGAAGFWLPSTVGADFITAARALADDPATPAAQAQALRSSIEKCRFTLAAGVSCNGGAS